jgi:hypothetical protein
MNVVKILIAGCLLFAPVELPARGEIDASVSPSQLVRGGAAQEIRIHGSGLTLTGIEITPPEGISIGEIKVRDPIPEDGLFSTAGVKVWTISVVIDKTAPAGERSVVAVTPKGKSAGKTLRIVTHTPNISALKIVSATPTGTEFTILASDEEDDLGGDKVSLLASYECGGRYTVTRCSVNKVVAKAKTLQIHAATPPLGYGQTVVGTCKFGVTLYDTGGIRSNELSQVVEYKQ